MRPFLDPDPGQARRWAEEELSKPEYQPPPLTRFQQWLQEWMSDHLGFGVGVSSSLATVVMVLVALALLAVLVAAVVRLRAERNPGALPGAAVLADTATRATDYLARAQAAYDSERYDDTVLDAVRAMTARGDEQGALPDVLGMTAREVGLRLSARVPERRAEIRTATDLFDAIRYDDRSARADEAASALGLVRDLWEATERAAGAGPLTWAVPR